MTREEFVKLIAQDADISNKEADAALKSVVNNITAILKAKDKLTLVGFGTFEVSERAARTGRNPKTGDTIKIAASLAAKFKPGKGLKEAVSGKSEEPKQKETAKKPKNVISKSSESHDKSAKKGKK